ncbi:hypothetical protein G7Z17_g11445 [Cylindrodendrum hubeiense]|uniref:Uncharacterized protein n=1 Tax=Cylindrodendrum hubeiense TaxID=595255 RepID=A0A9P5H0S2_9HYPO|nr:hypothetical protein G7Z17_g11445 [Cylindrodendrum hubeiense]
MLPDLLASEGFSTVFGGEGDLDSFEPFVNPPLFVSFPCEKKIDLLDKRLEEVTQLLQSRQTDLTSPGSQSAPSCKSPARVIPNQIPAEPLNSFENIVQSSSDSPVVEGESSLATQSAFANDFLRNAVHKHSTQDSSLELRETLDGLHRIINSMKHQSVAVEMAYPNAKPTVCSPIQDYELPPIQKTVALIQVIKNGKSEAISWMLDFCSIEHFSDLCLRVYFSKDFSEADFIIANAGLLYLFQYCANDTSDERNEALSFPDHVRNSRVHELANDLNEIMTKSAEINKLQEDVSGGTKIAWQSSRMFIQSILQYTCTGKTLLFAPFIPFIVLFCNVIETQDQMDLDRLGSFISSMESTPAISDQATRVVHLFRVLFNAARRYVEFRNSSPSADQGQARERLHTYMFELGLPVPPDNGGFQPHGTVQAQGEVAEQGTGDAQMSEGVDGQRATDYRIWMGNTTHLEDWFNSNQQMMELINEPNFNFHPPGQPE